MVENYTKDIKESVYHGAVVSALAIGYTMLGKMLVKMSPPSLGKFDIEDGVKLVAIVALSDFTKDYLIKQKIIPNNIQSMASIGFLIGGALVNALAFTGSNYLFSSLSKESIDKERKRHDKAIEDLQRAQIEWAKKRQERLDYINAQIMKQRKAEKRFADLNSAMQEYFIVTGRQLEPLPPKPVLSDFYLPSEDHHNRELTFIILSMTRIGAFLWYYDK